MAGKKKGMQIVDSEKKAELHPVIADVLQNIRNTHQALYMYFDGSEGAEQVISKDEIIKALHCDLTLMAFAENACKLCNTNK